MERLDVRTTVQISHSLEFDKLPLANQQVKVHFQNKGSLIAEIQNLLQKDECKSILKEVHSLDPSAFQSRGDRDGVRCIVIDQKLADGLWNRISNVIHDLADAVDSNEYPLIPMGWATSGKWLPLRLNECFRITEYHEESGGFAAHQDAAFVATTERRSIWTLVVFLEAANLEGGETEFEIDGRCIRIKPEIGSAVIFNHEILHSGLPVSNGKKVVMRSDVVFARNVDIEASGEWKRRRMEIQSLQQDPKFVEASTCYAQAVENHFRGREETANQLYSQGIELRVQQKSVEVPREIERRKQGVLKGGLEPLNFDSAIVDRNVQEIHGFSREAFDSWSEILSKFSPQDFPNVDFTSPYQACMDIAEACLPTDFNPFGRQKSLFETKSTSLSFSVEFSISSKLFSQHKENFLQLSALITHMSFTYGYDLFDQLWNDDDLVFSVKQNKEKNEIVQVKVTDLLKLSFLGVPLKSRLLWSTDERIVQERSVAECAGLISGDYVEVEHGDINIYESEGLKYRHLAGCVTGPLSESLSTYDDNHSDFCNALDKRSKIFETVRVLVNEFGVTQPSLLLILEYAFESNVEELLAQYTSWFSFCSQLELSFRHCVDVEVENEEELHEDGDLHWCFGECEKKVTSFEFKEDYPKLSSLIFDYENFFHSFIPIQDHGKSCICFELFKRDEVDDSHFQCYEVKVRSRMIHHASFTWCRTEIVELEAIHHPQLADIRSLKMSVKLNSSEELVDIRVRFNPVACF
jgi:prolyl 4-hydroxylase